MLGWFVTLARIVNSSKEGFPELHQKDITMDWLFKTKTYEQNRMQSENIIDEYYFQLLFKLYDINIIIDCIMWLL